MIGAFVDGDWYSNMEADAKAESAQATIVAFPVDLDVITAQSVKAEVEQNWSVTVGGRLGFLVTPDTLLYALGGYTWADVDANVRVAFSDPADAIGGGFGTTDFRLRMDDRVEGYTVGGGVETKLRDHVSLKFEYRYTDLDGESAKASDSDAFVSPGPIDFGTPVGLAARFRSAADADVDLDIHTVRAVLSYKFGHRGT